jgi:hypothetical protein
MDMGLRQRHAVAVLYVVTALAAGLGMFMFFTKHFQTILVFVCGLVPAMIVFRAVGAVKLRETYSAFQRNRAIARDVRHQRRSFEEMQVRLMEAKSLAQWWRVLRRAARRMGFARLVVEVSGGGEGITRLAWRNPRRDGRPEELIHVHIPTRNHRHCPIRTQIDLPAGSTLESVGRRVGLFGRLLDEPAPAVGHDPAAA